MQIQDAPGDNAGKKLRLTRLYQPVLKGRAYSLHLCLYLTRLSESSFPANLHTQCIRAFAAVGWWRWGGTRARSLIALCRSVLAHVQVLWASLRGLQESEYFLWRIWILELFPITLLLFRTLLLSDFFFFIESKLWISLLRMEGTFVLALAQRSIKLSFFHSCVNKIKYIYIYFFHLFYEYKTEISIRIFIVIFEKVIKQTNLK